MRTETSPKITRLADYTAPHYEIISTYLDFDLQPTMTRVRSKLEVKLLRDAPFVLNGENITLKSVSVNGRALKRSDYKLDQESLSLFDLPKDTISTVEIETVCNPKTNTTLMGLYVSTGRFCTQCEAEGFRRITYYPDRPDVMSVFTVRIEADLEPYPYLLSNGNKVESGGAAPSTSGAGRHFAVWHDPFPKPCYLFALVAGQFDVLEDSFTTSSGRNIPLEIFVDPGNAAQAEYAMDALKRAMKWDEEAFGREYDLDLFMIVAVRDFNFGAMENKGLNIFNSVLLLADATSATDLNFERIESVVAHEYFHNWTGNRITCRDWFQLCLKEGFTVFRDQEFSADQRGAAVQRIKDVRALRARQFIEDGGPLAHPVRPDTYQKIDNFYTATVYEKGAELIRMLKIWLGAARFRQACDLYFDRLDGTAATIEQFIDCFETSSGQDLSQFMLWYQQAGTPELTISREPSKTKTEQIVHITQSTRSTPGQPVKAPLVIPILWQVISDEGPLTYTQLTLMTTETTQLSYPYFETAHSLSILQDLSAPVTLKTDATSEDFLRLMRADPNAFNRWEAGQSLARQLISEIARAIETGTPPPKNTGLEGYCAALKATIEDPQFDNSFKALSLTPPVFMDVLQGFETIDPLALHEAEKWLRRAIGDRLRPNLLTLYHALADNGDYRPDAAAAGRRALRNRCLSLLASRRDPLAASLAQTQLINASNMTDELAALITLTHLGGQRVETTLAHIFERWKETPLILDKWFSVQAMRPHITGVEALVRLTELPSYERNNPNRVRALIGGFAMNNPAIFHKIDGSGYRFFTDQILDMDGRNPSVAARLLGAFEIWRKLDVTRKKLIQTELERIISSSPSKNLLEIAQKTRGL